MQTCKTYTVLLLPLIILLLSLSLAGCDPAVGYVSTTKRSTLLSPTLYVSTQTPTASPTGEAITNFSPVIVKEYPHDSSAFTQGLVIHENILYESTGLYGNSSIRKVNINTGGIEKIRYLPEQYFAEGIAIVNDRIIQITWKSGVGFVYNLETFELINTFEYQHEGWGLTYDGDLLYMSDGTEKIHVLNPMDYSEVDVIEVRYNNEPLQLINELEYIDGSIYANIWKTSEIAIIHPMSGRVTGWINLEDLVERFHEYPRHIDVLNGIAYNADKGKIYITGKLWPKLFEIQIIQP
ncbi:glutaminyl-peptide cyclotransferase [bacterium]|nr:glutaminyl-peptide cyclotransferase [bacterium]